MAYIKEIRDRIIIYKCDGELTINTTKELLEDIMSVSEDQATKIVFDLRNVEFMDSSGLGIITAAIRKQADIRIVYDQNKNKVKELIELVLADFAHTRAFSSVEKAINSFK